MVRGLLVWQLAPFSENSMIDTGAAKLHQPKGLGKNLSPLNDVFQNLSGRSGSTPRGSNPGRQGAFGRCRGYGRRAGASGGL